MIPFSSAEGPTFAILGAGPAGVTAATTAAALGARVVLMEESVVGGGAHLWDCIPSKTMAATAVTKDLVDKAARLGVVAGTAQVDQSQLAERIKTIWQDINIGFLELLLSQDVHIVSGKGRLSGPHRMAVETSEGALEFDFDYGVVSTGSAPRVPDWAPVDGKRVLTTRHAYDLAEVPAHLVIVGSGVTGVEFTHIFKSLGSEVSLVVSRQQILPHRDPEVAAVLQNDFLARGVKLVIGTYAEAIKFTEDGVVVECDDGRRVKGSHVLLAVGSVPLTAGIGLEEAGLRLNRAGHIQVDAYQRTSLSHIYAAGDCTGQMPLSSVAAAQGRKIARHALGYPVSPMDFSNVAAAVFTSPEIASVGLEDVTAAAQGRKVRTTKVPFASNPRSVLQGREEGFVKVISDPATRVVLGGTIVGHSASDLIGILALAVQADVTVDALLETLMVHPSLSESISEAAE